MWKQKKFKNYINGEFIDSKSGSSFKTIDPSNEKEFAEVSAAEEYEVNLAVESSYKAFNGEWSKILPYQRARYLRAIGDQLKDKAELLGTVETKNPVQEESDDDEDETSRKYRIYYK